ncbi:hypothetical protein OVA11_18970 [Caulobacter sp. SL161]|uniref:hypothetical protein n=1 Tax=Caulobacter sp. SL161 TaxID=2995156 RepID=UPI002276A028|nr:hypothetical protein [Caulobacter sp. SL161]MCY1649060.1 hypothetical protein [Caulobacter sp. SL161]
MADNTGDPTLLAALSKLAPYAPGAAGAVLSMAYGDRLTLRAKALSLASGAAAVAWLAPLPIFLLNAKWPGVGTAAGPFVGFACGFLGMALFGGLTQAVTKYAGDPFKLIKFEAGGLRIGGSDQAEG